MTGLFRKCFAFVGAVLVVLGVAIGGGASVANASSYLDVFGVAHDPILNTSGSVHGYHGPDVGPGVYVQIGDGGLVEADLRNAALQGATWWDFAAQNSNLSGANMTGFSGPNAQFWGADMTNTVLFGADFSGSYFDGSYFGQASAPILTGARYSLNSSNIADTLFPAGFDPVAAGMIAVPEPTTATLLALGITGLAARQRNHRRGTPTIRRN